MILRIPSRETFLYSLLAVLVFLGFMVLYAREISLLKHTLNVSDLLLWAAVGGLLIGLLLGWYFSQKVKDDYDRMRIWVAAALLSILIVPMLVHWSNRTLTGPVRMYDAEFFNSEPYISEPYGLLEGQEAKVDGHYTFLLFRNDMIRIETAGEAYPNKKKGDRVQLPLRTGLWGYEVLGFD